MNASGYFMIGMACTASCAAMGQRTVRYEFQMTLASNGITGSSHVGMLNGMPIGTQGKLTIVARDVVVAFDPTFKNYQVLDVSFEAGEFLAPGLPGFYPTAPDSIFGSLGIGNEALVLAPDQVSDYFVAAMFMSNPEIHGLTTLAILDEDEIDGQRQLFNTTELPEQMDIDLVDAEYRNFRLESAQNNASMDFDINAIEVVVVPAPGVMVPILLSVASIRRRR